MHKVFTKDEMYSINIYDRKTGSNESDIDNVVCELFIMKLVEPYEEDINIFSVYILSEDGVIEKWNGARNFICYNNVKEYSKPVTDEIKETFLKLMSLSNENETDNFEVAKNLVQKLDDTNDFLFDKDVKETALTLFDKHGVCFVGVE